MRRLGLYLSAAKTANDALTPPRATSATGAW